MSVTIQIEKFEQVYEELLPLFDRHWEELARFKDRMPLAPALSEYIKRERQGSLLLMVVRIAGKIVAYYVVQITVGLHYMVTKTAYMDIFYVVPEARGRNISRRLIQFVEAELKRRGVQLWFSGYKAHKPLGMDKLLSLFGFEPVDVHCAKWIGT